MPTWDADWSPVPKGPPPGLYLVEVDKVEGGVSKKTGDKYIRLSLVTSGERRKVCDDIVMIEGDQRWSGHLKLGVLGFSKENPYPSIDALIGKRAWVQTTQREFRNEIQSAIDNRAKGSKQGYWPENEKPETPFFNDIPLSGTQPVSDDPFTVF